MCRALIESIKAVFILSLLPINYQQHERLRVEVHRFDSSAVGVGGSLQLRCFGDTARLTLPPNQSNVMSSHAASVRGPALR